MLTSILAASDLSERSTPAIARAVELANAHAAGLCALHALEREPGGDWIEEEIARIEAVLTAQLEELGAPPAREIAVSPGHAFEVICAAAQSRAAELIVMGAHRRRALRDVFVGTTLERVTRSAGRPVLLANPGGRAPWGRVFIATDLSESSAHAARTALRLGLLDGAEVSFVHGFAPVTRQMMTHAGIPAERIHAEAEREFDATRRELARFLQQIDLGDLDHHARLIEGVGADALAGLVEQARPDLLVIGTRGLSGARRLFPGSVAQELMGSVACDVLAVPPQP